MRQDFPRDNVLDCSALRFPGNIVRGIWFPERKPGSSATRRNVRKIVKTYLYDIQTKPRRTFFNRESDQLLTANIVLFFGEKKLDSSFLHQIDCCIKHMNFSNVGCEKKKERITFIDEDMEETNEYRYYEI